MIVFETIAIAFSMYSAIPMPQFMWNERNMKFALCAFPLIGIVIGLAEWLAAALCTLCAAPAILRGALLCVLPVLLTGGIHLDGYCDTSDALASHAPQEKKLEILKDPHIGSFAVIHLACYFIMSLAVWTALPAYPAVLILLMFCISRILSALAVCTFPKAKNTGLASMFAAAADRKKAVAVLAVMLAVCGAALLCFGGRLGIPAFLAALLVFVYYRRMAMRQFGGITGDLAGWFLQQCEFWMLAAICAAEIVGNVL